MSNKSEIRVWPGADTSRGLQGLVRTLARESTWAANSGMFAARSVRWSQVVDIVILIL